jgi:hypothetical protein
MPPLPEPPSKLQVRHYLRQRHAERTPPPDRDEIRRRMGWDGTVKQAPACR